MPRYSLLVTHSPLLPHRSLTLCIPWVKGSRWDQCEKHSTLNFRCQQTLDFYPDVVLVLILYELTLMDLNTVFEILFGLIASLLAIAGLHLTYKYRQSPSCISIFSSNDAADSDHKRYIPSVSGASSQPIPSCLCTILDRPCDECKTGGYSIFWKR